MSYAQPFDYTEPYNNYAPTPNYYEAYAPRNAPHMGNPYHQGNRIETADLVVGYDPTQSSHIFETHTNQVLRGVGSHISTTSKSKRARNVNMLNHTFGSPRRAGNNFSPVLIREDFMGYRDKRLYPDMKSWFTDSGVIWDYQNY